MRRVGYLSVAAAAVEYENSSGGRANTVSG
jgi:TRAP-type uncharacterized transport system fused permease subunit